LNKIVEELSFAEQFVKKKYLFVKGIKKFYALCMAFSPKADKEKLQTLQNQHNVEILTYVKMVHEFLGELRT